MQRMLEDHGAFACPASNPNKNLSHTIEPFTADSEYATTTANNRTSTDDDTTTTNTCQSQTASLLNVAMVGQLMALFSPLLGEIADRYGTSTLMQVVATSTISGATLLWISVAQRKDQLLYGAFSLLGASAVATSVLMVQTGMLFLEPTRRRLISVVNALYDAGGITYWVLWQILQSVTRDGTNLEGLFLGYAVLSVTIFLPTVLLWRYVVPETEEEQQQKDLSSSSSSSLPPPSQHLLPAVANAGDDDRLGSSATAPTTVAANHNNCNRNNITTNHDTNKDEEEEEVNVSQVNLEDTQSETPLHLQVASSYTRIASRSPYQQLRSQQMILLTMFFGTMVARNIFVLTTAKDFLKHLGDDDFYLSIFTLMTPVSVIGLPFTERALHKYGYHAGFQCVNALALLHGIIQVASTNLNVQIVGFIIFSFFRCFLFAVTFSFLPTFLNPSVLGKATGVLVCLAGLMLLVNLPLANLAVNYWDGDFFWPNLFYTVVIGPCAILVWWIGKGIQREHQHVTTT